MYNVAYIAESFYPQVIGGAEIVDNTIITYLNSKDYNVTKLNTRDVHKTDLNKFNFLIFANIGQLSHPEQLQALKKNSYIIIEHDFKFITSRMMPINYKEYKFPDPFSWIISYYKNAKAVFLQTKFHEEVFNHFKIEGNFVNLECSIWGEKELEFLSNIDNEITSRNYCILDSNNIIKNTAGAIQFCKSNLLNYDLIPANNIYQQDLWNKMSQYSTLVMFPLLAETCCKIVVEAKCLGLNVITTQNYGASTSDWFKLDRFNLINYLDYQSKVNLEKILTHL